MKKEGPENLTEVAYNILYERIIKFNLPPGASVSDFSFSKELGISRTPVREAILKLFDDGLVEKTPKGFVVSNITPEDVRDLYDAREAIETSLLRLAMERGITDENIVHLRSLNAELKNAVTAGKIMVALDYDNQIHEYLAGLSQNQRLKLFYDKLAKQVVRMMVFSVAQDNQRANDEHEFLFSAIEDNDVEKACYYLKENISNAKTQHIEVLSKLKDGWIGLVKFIYTT